MTDPIPRRRSMRPSDTPGRTPLLLGLLRDRRRLEQHQRNLSYARRWVEATFVTLERIQRLVVPLAAGPHEATLAATAARTELARLLDKRIDDRPLFAGTAAVERAFDENGHYLGDETPVAHQLTDDLVLGLGVTGRLFDPGPDGGSAPLLAVMAAIGLPAAGPRPSDVSESFDELNRFVERLGAALRHLRHQRHQLGDLEASTADALMETHSHWIQAHRSDDPELRERSAEASVDATLSATDLVIGRSLEDVLGPRPRVWGDDAD